MGSEEQGFGFRSGEGGVSGPGMNLLAVEANGRVARRLLLSHRVSKGNYRSMAREVWRWITYAEHRYVRFINLPGSLFSFAGRSDDLHS